MSTLHRVLGGTLLAFALARSHVAWAGDEQSISLMITPKVGRTVRMKSVIKTIFLGKELVITRTQKATVTEVKANGDVVEEIVDEGGTMSSAGEEEKQPAIAPYTVIGDKFGKRKEFRKAPEEGAMKPEISQLIDMFGLFVLTDKTVKPNDTWRSELENPAVPEKKVILKNTYLGIEKLDGKDYWKIKQTGEAIVNAEGGKMISEATEWVNPTTGEPFKIEDTLKDVPTPAGTLTLQIVKSIKTDDKDKPVKKSH
ncbi:MAG: hypothetical protein JWN14_4814 [Chthonomonadales bacterium]|nr:hypothetical protein [Chthonomonadales bacterium]